MKLRLTVLPTVILTFLLSFACPASAAPKKVTLTWQPPTAVTGVTITGYKIYRGTASGSEGTTAFGTVTSGTVLTFIDSSVTGGTSYFYQVTATGTCDVTVWDCSAFQTESAKSNEAASGAIPLPSAPAIGAPQAATAVVQ